MKNPIIINYNVRGPGNQRQAIITQEQLDSIKSELRSTEGAWAAVLEFDRKVKAGPRDARVADYVTDVEPILSRVLTKHVSDPSLVFWQVLFALLEDESSQP